MSTRTVHCPNAGCGASLKVPAQAAPGAKVRCPRCGNNFALPKEGAAAVDSGALALEPEADQPCPSCKEMLPGGAVLCVHCGFDRRTGRKVEGPKKAAKKKGPRREGGPVTEAELPQVVDEAEKLIELARRELWRIPRVLGLGEDPDTAALVNVGGRGKCANPDCHMGVDASMLMGGGMREGTSRVRITLRAKTVWVELCEACTEMLMSDLQSRDGTARGFLKEAKADVDRIARRFPDHPAVKELRQEIRKTELLANAEKPRSRMCFIATAAFGDEDAEAVEVLRRFRDEVLARSVLGRLLVRVYELLSPPLADMLARSERGRMVVRSLLGPVAALCRRRLGGRGRTETDF